MGLRWSKWLRNFKKQHQLSFNKHTSREWTRGKSGNKRINKDRTNTDIIVIKLAGATDKPHTWPPYIDGPTDRHLDLKAEVTGEWDPTLAASPMAKKPDRKPKTKPQWGSFCIGPKIGGNSNRKTVQKPKNKMQ